LIEVRNLCKKYGDSYAIKNLNFNVKKGIYGFLGPNGAGKTTTMNIITGCLAATEGSVMINGHDIFEEPVEAKKLIGYLPEQPPLYPEMTVTEFLNFVYELKKCTLPREPHIEELVDVVKLFDVKDRLIKNLSKGYKQRVGIAAALVGDPKIVIFDEPTVGLDPKQIIEVRNLIRELGKKHTVVLSTHILAEVQSVCERIIIINKGKIIADEKTDEIVKTIEGGYSLSVKVAGPEREVESMLGRIIGVKKVRATGERDLDAYTYIIESEKGVDIRKSIFSLCSSKGWAILGLNTVGTDLESVFIKLIDRGEVKEMTSAKKNKRR